MNLSKLNHPKNSHRSNSTSSSSNNPNSNQTPLSLNRMGGGGPSPSGNSSSNNNNSSGRGRGGGSSYHPRSNSTHNSSSTTPSTNDLILLTDSIPPDGIIFGYLKEDKNKLVVRLSFWVLDLKWQIGVSNKWGEDLKPRETQFRQTISHVFFYCFLDFKFYLFFSIFVILT